VITVKLHKSGSWNFVDISAKNQSCGRSKVSMLFKFSSIIANFRICKGQTEFLVVLYFFKYAGGNSVMAERKHSSSESSLPLRSVSRVIVRIHSIY
jgi:hypothetical protein